MDIFTKHQPGTYATGRRFKCESCGDTKSDYQPPRCLWCGGKVMVPAAPVARVSVKRVEL